MKSLPGSLLLSALVGFGLAASTFAAPVELLTAAEAARPNPPAAENAARFESEARTTPAAGAPQIIVDLPVAGVGLTAPFPVKIRFVPATGAKINLDSLKIDVLKLVPISLLSRVRPYLSSEGINVPEAKIPAGIYNVRIAVTDDQGREGSTLQTWTVH